VTLRRLAAAWLAAAPALAGAGAFPTRGGETGLLDVPDAGTAPLRGADLALEMGLRAGPGVDAALAPLPLSLVTGLASRAEVGFAARQCARPGDPKLGETLFSGALKLRLLDGGTIGPAVAVDVYADRFNLDPRVGARLILASSDAGRARLSAFGGAEGRASAPAGAGPTAGLAAAVGLGASGRVEAVADALAGPSGPMAGAALRYQLTGAVGFSLGLDWLPRDGGVRASVGIAIAARPPGARLAATAEEEAAAAPAPAAPAGPVFGDDRPRFRIRIAPRTEPGQLPPHEHDVPGAGR